MNHFSLLAQNDAGGFVIGGLLFLIFAIVGLAALALWIWALVSAIQNPALDSTMRIIWVLVIIFTQLIGAILYLILAPRGTAGGPPPTV